jgi:hypothetical protein
MRVMSAEGVMGVMSGEGIMGIEWEGRCMP